MNSSLFIRGSIIISLIASSASPTFAAPPNSKPSTSSAPNGGYFQQYFTNIQTPCASMEVVTGFNSNLITRCRPFSQFMATLMGVPGLPGQVVTGFSATTGAPAYTNFSTLMQNFLSTGTPGLPGQVVGGFTPGGLPTYVQGSPWLTNGTSLYYNAGNIGIGTSSPTAKLHVNGGKVELGGTTEEYLPGGYNWDYTLQLNTQDTSSIGFHDANANVGSIRFRNNLFSIGGNDGWGVANTLFGGTVTSSAFIYSSDRNLKTNIIPLDNSLEKILSLSGYSFDWKSDDRSDIGVIAQEVEKVYPELVHTDTTTGMKAVEYGNLVAPLIEAVKSQQREIESLKSRIEKLESAR